MVVLVNPVKIFFFRYFPLKKSDFKTNSILKDHNFWNILLALHQLSCLFSQIRFEIF